MRYQNRNRKNKFRSGLTLIELTITMTINLIVILAVGVLLVGGNRAWLNNIDSANDRMKQDELATTVAFGSMGRKSNRLNYTIYNVNGGTFTPAVPQTPGSLEVVSGDAVEFRYWDVELDEDDSQNLLDTTNTGTAYALFYLDGDELKLDEGPYPPGAVPGGEGARNTSDIITRVLARNVSTEDSDVGAFSHTTLNGVGQGSVRIKVVLTNPDTGKSVHVMTTTLMRNIWPR